MLKRKYLIAVLLSSMSALWAPAAVAAIPSEEDRIIQQWVEQFKKEFSVPADAVIDPSLRQAADAIAKPQIARMEALIRSWVKEEIALSKTAISPIEALRRVDTRITNERVLSRLESVSEANDEAWLHAMLKADACDSPPEYSWFAVDILRIQAAPKEKRDALLRGEAELLRRWGTVRTNIPPLPAEPVADQVMAAMTRIRAGEQRTIPPMTPLLAWKLLDREPDGKAPDWYLRCRMAQWWWHWPQHHADPAARQAAQAAYRYAVLYLPGDWDYFNEERYAGKKEPDFGWLGSYFGVEGTITVAITVGPEGQVMDAKVHKRDVRVEGVRGNRPVAYETMLDKPALKRARAMTFAKPASESLNNGKVTKLQEFAFKLN